MPQNIDDFNFGVARILGKLYEEFPKSIHFSVNDLAILDSMKEGPIQREEIDRHLELHEIYFHTARFLLAEGYIRGNVADGSTIIDRCTLTIKGLAALQKVPESIQEKKSSVGDYLLELGKDGLKAATKEAVSTAVRTIFNG